jgi:hypothetical protein
LKRAQEGVLYKIVGVGQVSRPSGQPAGGVPAERREVPLDEALESILIAITHALNQYSG